MNLETYQKETIRTCPGLQSEPVDLAHMVLGMCSEFSELLLAKSKNDDINISEEIADTFWYLSNYCNIRNYSLQELWETSELQLELFDLNQYNINNYFYCLAELQDLVKKNLAYGKVIDTKKEIDCLLSYMISMRVLWRDVNFDLEKSLENNINKLKIRFPDKFTKENAINRDLEKERIELEK